jgi:hypothetical protein
MIFIINCLENHPPEPLEINNEEDKPRKFLRNNKP